MLNIIFDLPAFNKIKIWYVPWFHLHVPFTCTRTGFFIEINGLIIVLHFIDDYNSYDTISSEYILFHLK